MNTLELFVYFYLQTKTMKCFTRKQNMLQKQLQTSINNKHRLTITEY